MSEPENDNIFTPAEQATWDAQLSDGPAPVLEVPSEPENDPEITVQGEPLRAAEPEVVAEADDDGDEVAESPAKPGFVPHRKLHKALERAKASEEREKLALERLERLLAVSQPQQVRQAPQPAPEAPKVPRAEEDVFQTADYAVQEVQQLKAYIHRQQQEQALLAEAAPQVQRFVAEKPDFNEAVGFLIEGRVRELVALGHQEHAARGKAKQEELALVAHARQVGKNPAELAYNWALSRGYSPKAAEPPAQPKQTAAEQIGLKADVQARAKSLSHGSGSAPPATAITAETILRMDSKEFNKFAEKYPKKLAQLMGNSAA
jgi:hypothetical protein